MRLTKKAIDSDMTWFVDNENDGRLLEPCEMGYHHCGLAIRKLAKYEEAEEHGLLLFIPCKVGDIVWDYKDDSPAGLVKCIVKYMGFNTNGEPYCDYETMDGSFYLRKNLKEFGKTLFLSKESAKDFFENKNEK